MARNTENARNRRALDKARKMDRKNRRAEKRQTVSFFGGVA